jgi:hypothetical protein
VLPATGRGGTLEGTVVGPVAAVAEGTVVESMLEVDEFVVESAFADAVEFIALGDAGTATGTATGAVGATGFAGADDCAGGIAIPTSDRARSICGWTVA